jgi:hypothetical protein
VDDKRLLNRVTVVYPAVRNIQDSLIQFADRDVNIVNILFSGDFFLKGGVNVIDAFERAQRIYPPIRLTLCCDEKINFNIANTRLRKEYLEKIKSNDGIAKVGRLPREKLLTNILPTTDCFVPIACRRTLKLQVAG